MMPSCSITGVPYRAVVYPAADRALGVLSPAARAASVLLLVGLSVAWAQTPADTVVIYAGGASAVCDFRPWSMRCQEKLKGGAAGGKHLWFNYDWQAKPWAGVAFEGRDAPVFTVTGDWLALGFVQFWLNVGTDRYGNPGGGVPFQIRPMVQGLRYQAVRSQFIDSGRGADEDAATWQRVLVPLSYWTELSVGAEVTGLHVQCRGRPERSFGLDDIAFVRYATQPEWFRQQASEEVAQPWVTWPAYAELPEASRADHCTPAVRNGRFVGPDGERIFVLNPYCREDPRLDVWGTLDADKRPPDHGLYDRGKHGWIYEELPTRETLYRLGFNSYSATMPPQPWWDTVGYGKSDGGGDAARLPDFYRRVGVPFFVDTVSWPWTLGAPGMNPDKTALPPDACTEGRNHWTQYRLIGKGREAWLSMWRLYAERYRDAGVPVLAFELMNEPAYLGVSPDHMAEFAEWLESRYADVERLNSTWLTQFPSWREAADVSADPKLTNVAGRFFDYDEYLSGRFTELIEAGVRVVSSVLPDALVGVQVMGGYALSPREAVWKHRFCRTETVVLTPTGGGRWTTGRAATERVPDALDAPMAGSPLEDDLLLSLAEGKMLYDNETYLRGQTAVEVRNRLWQQVIAGIDGLTVFSWSKRGWAWWRDRAKVRTEADKFPYSNLNPIARRTAALRGVYDFAREVQPVAGRILPKPWGPAARIGLLYSWPQARRCVYEPELGDKIPHYHAALKYSHWNVAVLPSDRVVAAGVPGDLDVLIVAGVRHCERELPERLERFARAGGVLIVGEETFDRDVYAHAVDTAATIGVESTGVSAGAGAVVSLAESTAASVLPGSVRLVSGVRTLRLPAGTGVVVRDSTDRPIVTRKALGSGLVYFQAADVAGYALASLLWAILADAAQAKGHESVPWSWRLAEIRDPATGQLAPNVLLSRRSHDGYHALLLLNRDRFDKPIRVQLDVAEATWTVREALSGRVLSAPGGGDRWTAPQLRDAGFTLELPAESPAVVLIERAIP